MDYMKSPMGIEKRRGITNSKKSYTYYCGF